MPIQGETLAVDVRTAAMMLSVSPRTTQNYLKAKVLPGRKIGRRTVIPLRALENFLRTDHPTPLARQPSNGSASRDGAHPDALRRKRARSGQFWLSK
jgi:hypothetical protein